MFLPQNLEDVMKMSSAERDELMLHVYGFMKDRDWSSAKQIGEGIGIPEEIASAILENLSDAPFPENN